MIENAFVMGIRTPLYLNIFLGTLPYMTCSPMMNLSLIPPAIVTANALAR